jgi:hypothetical protein
MRLDRATKQSDRKGRQKLSAYVRYRTLADNPVDYYEEVLTNERQVL